LRLAVFHAAFLTEIGRLGASARVGFTHATSIIALAALSSYTIRPATLQDADALVHHRLSMFRDMGVPMDATAVETAFRSWLTTVMPDGTFRAWIVQEAGGRIVGGGSITVIPWPPGPQYLGGRLAYVYNVYTEPDHRQRGVARLVMDAIHAWCRENGVGSLALNASEFGRSLYEAIGYQIPPSPMMFLSLE
jgi:GNAT superfamily N-acetyltransferase